MPPDEADSDLVGPSPYRDRRPFLLRATHRAGVLAGAPHELALFVLVLGVYVFGAVLAWTEGLATQYLAWFVLPAILFALGWVTGWLEWGRQAYVEILWKWRHNFDERYEPLLKPHLKRILGDWGAVWIILPVMALGEGDIIGVRISGGKTLQVASFSNWIVLGPLPLFIFLLVVLSAVGIIAGLAINVVLDHVLFMRQLSRLPLDPYRLLSADAYLGDLAKFGFASSMAWFVGVAVAGIILYGDLNAETIPLYAFAAAVGLTFFFVPQMYIHRMIVKSKRGLKARLRRQLPDDWEQETVFLSNERVPHILGLIQDADRIEDWPIDVPVIIAEVMAALIPFVATYLTQLVGLRITVA